MTLLSYGNRSGTELPAYIEEISANYLYKDKIGTPGGIPTHAKLRFDRRQTIVVVLTPFECKNATRLQCFPSHCTHISYIHHSRYKWKSPLTAKSRTILLPVAYHTLFYPFALKPVPCENKNSSIS